jgi:magnesium transporter
LLRSLPGPSLLTSCIVVQESERLTASDPVGSAAPPLFADIADQFEVIKTMADGQREFRHGVIEFYQTRTSTHLTIAAQKSASTGVRQNEDMRRITAWVAIVAVPTAVTGFFGQNVPYPGFGTAGGFIASALIIIILASVLFIIFKRKGWL